MSQQRTANIDALRRDPDDGAYHCPKCDAPFTRRSNLRRHYSIHTRNRDVGLKCHGCGKAFSSSSAFQSHIIQCTSGFLEVSAPTIAHDPHLPGLNSVDQPANTAGVSHHGHEAATMNMFSMDLTPTFTQEDSLNLDEFLSTFSNASSPTSPSLSPFTDPNSLFDESWATRDLSSSTSDEGSENIENRTSRHFRARQRPHTGDQYVARRKKEKPIYTRRQVEDMLEIVSNTFVGRIEEIIHRSNFSNTHRWGFSDGEASAQSPTGSSGYDA